MVLCILLLRKLCCEVPEIILYHTIVINVFLNFSHLKKIEMCPHIRSDAL